MSEKRLFSSAEAFRAAYADTDTMLDDLGEVPMEVLTASQGYQRLFGLGYHTPASFAYTTIEGKLQQHDFYIFGDAEEFHLYDRTNQSIGDMKLKTNYDIGRQEIIVTVPNLILDPVTVRSELVLIHDASDETFGTFNGSILDTSTDTELLCDTLASLAHTKLVVNE